MFVIFGAQLFMGAQIGFTVRTAFFVMIAVRTYTFMGFIKGGVLSPYIVHWGVSE